MKHLIASLLFVSVFLTLPPSGLSQKNVSKEQLAKWLKRFPKADANGDGQLTMPEALAYRDQALKNRDRKSGGQASGRPAIRVDPGWQKDRFPEHAVCYKTPEEIKTIYGTVQSFEKPADGALRIVGTGHSFMAPGYRTLPIIVRASGFTGQPLYTHTGGGVTGSARYKWEQENGIFQFDRKPVPKLLASIANAKWEAMMWGPYFNDRPEYYLCWMDFCLKYNPDMKFYLSDAWPQVGQLKKRPQSEKELTAEVITRLGKEKNLQYDKLMQQLNAKHPGRTFILPTNDAMVLAAQRFHRGELPGVKGINTFLGKEKLSLWRDPLGHLGPGFDRLEGYVFYATLYGRSPELIQEEIPFGRGQGEPTGFPSPALDKVLREIAWEAVIGNPHSGVKDKNGNGVNDHAE